MDDQRPVSAAEKAFFNLGTGSGILLFFFFLEVPDISHLSSACCAYFHQV